MIKCKEFSNCLKLFFSYPVYVHKSHLKTYLPRLFPSDVFKELFGNFTPSMQLQRDKRLSTVFL